MRHPLLRQALSVVVAINIVTTVGCSIPTDDRAHEIPTDAIAPVMQPPSSATTSPVASEGSRSETIYLVRTGEPTSSGSQQLDPMVIDIPGSDDINQIPRLVIERLINLSPAEFGQNGLVNALPKSTKVIDANIDDNDILNLNLSGLAEIESALQRLAVAQVVFTVTGLTGTVVKGVRFSVDGELASVPVEEGTKAAGDVVTRDDYPKLRDQVASIEATVGSD